MKSNQITPTYLTLIVPCQEFLHGELIVESKIVLVEFLSKHQGKFISTR